MGLTRHGIPIELALRLAQAGQLAEAVETGTYLGGSARRLAEHFASVTTIEIDPALHHSAKERLKGVGNITFVLEDSAEALAGISTDGAALFWLDGHWSGGDTGGEESECPVLAEIDAIDALPNGSASVILIDDARLFLGPPPPPHREDKWPTIMEVADRLRSRHPRHVTIIEDVVVAVPPALKGVVDGYWLELTSDPSSPALGTRIRRLLGL